MKDFILNLNNMNLKSKIEYCLEKYPETRNSDVKLTNSIWVEYYRDRLKTIDGKAYVALVDLYDMPREDNVKRIRAKIQNEENRFLPTTLEVVRQRKINEEIWRNKLGYNGNTI